MQWGRAKASEKEVNIENDDVLCGAVIKNCGLNVNSKKRKETEKI